MAARADVYAKAMAQMGYTAMGVGVHDLVLGVDALKTFGKKAKLTVLASNLYDTKTGKPVFQRTMVKQVGPLKIGLLSLMTPSPQELGKWVVDAGMHLKDPVEEAKTAVAEVQAQGAEIVVVLSQMRRQEIEKLAELVPEVDLVLGSADMDLSTQLTGVGKSTYFVDAFTKGKYVGEVTVQLREQRNRYYAAKARESLGAERSQLAQQVQSLQAQLEGADKPDSPLKLTKETRAVMESQLAAARARMQGVTLQLEGQLTTPPGASTLDYTATALTSQFEDESTVDGLVKKHQQKFTKIPGH